MRAAGEAWGDTLCETFVFQNNHELLKKREG